MMSRIQNVLLLSCVIFLYTCASLCAEPLIISQQKFSSNFHGFAEGTLAPVLGSGESRHAKENIHYVFITGFLSFQYPEYFVEQMRVVEQLGVPRRNIHLITPASRLSVEQNANWIKRELENIPGKLVVIAHSKGGAETFTMALKNSKLIEDRVDGMYLMQAAIGGSSLSDIMLDPKFNWKQFTDFSPLEQKTIVIERAKALVPKYFFKAGLMSLQTDFRQTQVQKLITENPAAVEAVSPKIHYLTSSVEDGTKYSTVYRTHWKVLNVVAGKSDGVVQTKSQSVEGIGNIIFHSDAGHGDYTNADRSILPINRRVALTKSIVTAVETKNSPEHPLCVWVFGRLSK